MIERNKKITALAKGLELFLNEYGIDIQEDYEQYLDHYGLIDS
jgi:hypothetical protein